jgi:hypothetical protein
MGIYLKPLEGSKLKVKRAKEHFRQIEAEIKTFNASKPYRIMVEEEPQSGDQLYRVKIKKQPPPMWATIIGDIVHNLRSALDLLVNDAVRANGNTPNRYTGFPVYKSADAFEAGFSGKVRGVSTKAIETIKSLKPYKDGNEALWHIHCLDITDKHRLILSVGSAYRNFNVVLKMRVPWEEGEVVKSPPIALKPADQLYPLKDGAVVMCVKAAARMSHSNDAPDYQFTFEVAFGDGEIVQGEPVLPTLQQLITSVESIIDIFGHDVFSSP